MMTTQRSATGSRLTPVDPSYATCERTCAVLRIYSGQLHPAEVTARLDLQPSSTVATGEASPPNSLGHVRVGKLNGWFLSSEENVTSMDLRDHLDWLLTRLISHAQALHDLQDESGVTMSVNCPWWSRGMGGPTLWPEQMQQLTELNLEISFDFAYYGDPEPES